MCLKFSFWMAALAALLVLPSAARARALSAAADSPPGESSPAGASSVNTAPPPARAVVQPGASVVVASPDPATQGSGPVAPRPPPEMPRPGSAPPAAAADSAVPLLPSPPPPFRPCGPFVSVGYGLHRYSMKTLSMEQDSDDRRAFDGGYLSVQAGYLSSWGGLIGLDWVHHSGKTNLNTQAASLALRLRSDFVSLMTGIQFGGHVRFHLALLTGVAMAEFGRTVRVEETEDGQLVTRRDANKSSPLGFLLGLDVGLVVMPTAWLAIGLRARADAPLFNDDLDGTGGLYLGLTAAYVFPL